MSNEPFIQYGQSINECNGSASETDHAPSCHGQCNRQKLTDLEVDLKNEVTRWDRMQMLIQGVPKVHPPMPVNGIGVDILHLDLKLKAIIKLLSIDEDKLRTAVQEELLELLTTLREVHEAAVEAEESVLPPIFIPRPVIITNDDNGEIKH